MELMLNDLTDRLSDYVNQIQVDPGVKGKVVTYDPVDMDLAEEGLQIKHYENLFRSSFLVSLYSFLELWLKRECYNQSKLRAESKKAMIDLQHGGIYDARFTFLKCLRGIISSEKVRIGNLLLTLVVCAIVLFINREVSPA